MKNKIIITLLFFLYVFVAQSQTLQEYLTIAKQNSSAIQITDYEYELAKEKINEVGNYENTNLDFGYYLLTPETRVGAQIAKLGIQQKLPWFGTIKAEKDLAASNAEIKQYDKVLSERDLIYKVKEAYYNLYEKQIITEILKDNKQILKTYENMAMAALENNRATMSDVLEIRIQKNELHSKLFQNINKIEALSRNFNRLLQRDENTVLSIIDSLSVLDILISSPTIDKHPSLAKINQIDQVLSNENDLIDKEKMPKIEFGINYTFVEKRGAPLLVDNGKDVIMPTFSLSLPIFTKEYKSRNNQIKIKQDKIWSEKINQTRVLEIALENAVLSFNNAVLAVFTSQKNQVETQRAINVDLKAYEAGILDYDKILKLQIQKIKYQLMEIEAIKKAFVANAKVEYLSE